MKLELTKKEIALIQEMIDDAKDRARDRLNECYDDEDFARSELAQHFEEIYDMFKDFYVIYEIKSVE